MYKAFLTLKQFFKLLQTGSINPLAYQTKLKTVFAKIAEITTNPEKYENLQRQNPQQNIILEIFKESLKQERNSFKFLCDTAFDQSKLSNFRQNYQQAIFISNHPLYPRNLNLSCDFLNNLGLQNSLNYEQTHFPILRKILEDDFMNLVCSGQVNSSTNLQNLTLMLSIGIDSICQKIGSLIIQPESKGNTQQIIQNLQQTGKNLFIYPQGGTKNRDFKKGYLRIAKQLKIPIIIACISDVNNNFTPILTKGSTISLKNIYFPQDFDNCCEDWLNKTIQEKVFTI